MCRQKIARGLGLPLLLLLSFATGCGDFVVNKAGWISSFTLVNQSSNIPVLQGYASAGTPDDSVNYFFDTSALYLSSSPNSLVEVASNHDLLLDGTNHMGDGDFYDGKVYGVIEHWAGCRTSSAPIYIVIFDGKSLAAEKYIEITSDLPEASGIAIVPDSREAVVTSFCDPNNLYAYDLSDWKFHRKIPLSMPIVGIQGAAFRDGFLYIAGTNGGMYALELANNSMHFLFQASMGGEFEGPDFHTSQLRWFVNHGYDHFLLSYAPTRSQSPQ